MSARAPNLTIIVLVAIVALVAITAIYFGQDFYSKITSNEIMLKTEMGPNDRSRSSSSYSGEAEILSADANDVNVPSR